jgi:hypothetical protein
MMLDLSFATDRRPSRFETTQRGIQPWTAIEVRPSDKNTIKTIRELRPDAWHRGSPRRKRRRIIAWMGARDIRDFPRGGQQ